MVWSQYVYEATTGFDSNASDDDDSNGGDNEEEDGSEFQAFELEMRYKKSLPTRNSFLSGYCRIREEPSQGTWRLPRR